MDNPKGQNRDTEIASALMTIFEQRMEEAVKLDEDLDYKAQRTMQWTQWLSHTSLFLSLVMTPVIFYLIATLVVDMGKITEYMEQMSGEIRSMKQDFGTVSLLMQQMDTSVGNMSHNIAIMPKLDTQVAGMHQNFSHMVHSMRGIDPNVTEINRLLGVMDYNMTHMNYLFTHLNYSVHFIGRDVDTLSSPMRMMPPFFGR